MVPPDAQAPTFPLQTKSPALHATHAYEQDQTAHASPTRKRQVTGSMSFGLLRMGGRMQCMACRPHSDRCPASRPTCTGAALKLSSPPDGPDGAAVCEVDGVCTTGSPGTWSSWVLDTVDTWPAWQRSTAYDGQAAATGRSQAAALVPSAEWTLLDMTPAHMMVSDPRVFLAAGPA